MLLASDVRLMTFRLLKISRLAFYRPGSFNDLFFIALRITKWKWTAFTILCRGLLAIRRLINDLFLHASVLCDSDALIWLIVFIKSKPSITGQTKNICGPNSYEFGNVSHICSRKCFSSDIAKGPSSQNYEILLRRSLCLS